VAQTKFKVKRHFTIRIADTRRIKFVFFPYQYLQNFSVSDQNPGNLSIIKHVREGATGKKFFIIVFNVMDYNQINGLVQQDFNLKTNYF